MLFSMASPRLVDYSYRGAAFLGHFLQSCFMYLYLGLVPLVVSCVRQTYGQQCGRMVYGV